ncbi:MAG: hypothetical protein LBP76_11005 [Treponema sp.]|jgi:hypothetical protein|nr:hypothetical protein [Treponema sp.]
MKRFLICLSCIFLFSHCHASFEGFPYYGLTYDDTPESAKKKIGYKIESEDISDASITLRYKTDEGDLYVKFLKNELIDIILVTHSYSIKKYTFDEACEIIQRKEGQPNFLKKTEGAVYESSAIWKKSYKTVSIYESSGGTINLFVSYE